MYYKRKEPEEVRYQAWNRVYLSEDDPHEYGVPIGVPAALVLIHSGLDDPEKAVENPWCRRGDSNPHTLSDNGF